MDKFCEELLHWYLQSQIYEIYSGRNNKKYIPHLLGHEATGIVVDKHYSVKS